MKGPSRRICLSRLFSTRKGLLVLSLTGCPSAPEQGDILNVSYLGTDPPTIPWGEYDVAVFYLKYWSGAAGGCRIAAKLFIPVGHPPQSGWPVKVWLHGFGGPGVDFWNWPFSGDDWRGRGYGPGMAFSNHGFISLCPWVTGAGPSEPFATYSPLSLDRNAQAAFDGFTALSNLPAYFRSHPALGRQAGVEVVVDVGRQVMSTNCISSPTMVRWASQWQAHPEVAGLKAILADTFQPSVAYIAHCLGPYGLAMEDALLAAGVHGLWAGPVWCLAEEKGWPLTLFFNQPAIDLLQSPVDTPAGALSLMRSARLEPPDQSHVAGPIHDAVKADVGHDPSSEEIAGWMFTEKMLTMAGNGTIEEIPSNPFYRTYFADSDPFFEENIEPFDTRVPLLVVSNGSLESKVPGLPAPAERFHCMTEPRIETLDSWGWEVRLFFEEGVETYSLSPGPGHNWAMQEFADILYPDGPPGGLP